jgi:hypothetical protein
VKEIVLAEKDSPLVSRHVHAVSKETMSSWSMSLNWAETYVKLS